MWNHTQVDNNMSSNNQQLTYEQKLQKLLDISPYLQYLEKLFNQPSSDSDSSDSEPELGNHMWNASSWPSNKSNNESKRQEPDPGSPASSESNNNLSPRGSSPFSSASTLSSTSSTGTTTTSDSEDHLQNGTSSHTPTNPFNLPPISDTELENLFKADKNWKKSSHPLGSQADIMSLLNAVAPTTSKTTTTPKTTTTRPTTSRQNCKQSSSNASSKSRPIVVPIASKASRPRKQSMKNVKKETVTQPIVPPKVPEVKLVAATVPIPVPIQIKVEEPEEQQVEIKTEFETLEAKPHVVPPLGNFMEGEDEDEDDDDDEDSSEDEDDDDEDDDDDSSEDDEDDNDSLSDFVSMAAAAQTGSNLTAAAAAAMKQKNIVFKSVTSKAPMAGSSAGQVFGGGGKVKKELRRKVMTPQKHAKLIQVLNMKRRKVYVLLCKKEIGKTQRARTNTHKENVAIKRRLAQACSRLLRQKAIQSQKVMKESVWRAKRLTREMLAYWKQADRVEREVRKRREKEAEEQRKFDVELMEAKRQQRKLNFLITQTELYAHFMSKKLGTSGQGQSQGQQGLKEKNEVEILSQLNEEKDGRLAKIDDYDVEAMKRKAKQNVENAFQTQLSQVKFFDLDALPQDFLTDSKSESKSLEFQQPKIFEGILKHYQLKGLNWLASLYNQGINGILADEMGLGKTVQSMAFLAHVAERYGVWGPFLIIAPASTLHNWQQEFKRFVPTLKVVPYWGTPGERKILRQFWQQGNLHTEEASFHVVITSYQIVMTDIKYFNRIKWQYLVLDEAQAIKSSTSARWKMLLGFSCRNRLLLTGTPIQNSMAELWALLHFIMPSLFDSHEEFNEWFSKDIESHAENKSLMDERHLGRLHLILKPFMLRRIKKDVENELSDKVEVLVHCPLTSRQRQLYTALKKKIRIEDLLKSSSNSQLAQHATTNLMNLVMQFRKVCNHPDLFERRRVQSPHLFPPIVLQYPRIIFREVLESSGQQFFEQKFSIFHPESLHRALKNQESNWSFARFIGLSVQEICTSAHGDTFQILKLLVRLKLKQSLVQHARNWTKSSNSPALNPLNLLWLSKVPADDLRSSLVLQDLLFVKPNSSLYTFKTKIDNKTAPDLEPSYLPPFLYYNNMFKIQAPCAKIYFSDRSAAWKDEERLNFGSEEEQSFVLTGRMDVEEEVGRFLVEEVKGLEGNRPTHGWSSVVVPAKQKLISDSGKLGVLDVLLQRLKSNSHRVLIYSQMTKMIDILEEYMCLRKWTYMRLDGSSKISERRDMVADFQSRADIFVFLLSTRAGGLGINLTAADVVIFYDSDWNPTVDQQAMDRAHRLGQTKQVYVYRLICKGTIEERILERAREKNEIQRMVISGGHFRPDTLKPKEVVSLLLDDEELEKKYRQKQAERRMDDAKTGDKTGKLISIKRKREKLEDGAEDSPARDVPEDVTGSEVIEGDLSDEDKDEGSTSDGSSKDEHEPASPALTGEESSSLGLKTIEWNADSISDYEGEYAVLPKRPKVGRGTGKRGRPPSRVRLPTRDPEGSGDNSVRRGPGRPRLRPVGPANQGVRGRRPGRPPLSRKPTDSVQPSTSSASPPAAGAVVTSTSAIPTTSLTPLTASQKVFGFYSSPDIDIV